MINRISFDFFGTLSAQPELFRQVLPWFHKQNISVFVVCGPRRTDAEIVLKNTGYERHTHYNAIYSVIDFLYESSCDMYYDSIYKCWSAKNSENWWSAKAKICEKYLITTHIDSDTRYAPFFYNVSTRFVHFTDSSLRDLYRILRKSL